MVALIGVSLARDVHPTLDDLRRLCMRSLAQATPVTLTVFPALLLMFAGVAGVGSSSADLLAVAPLIVVPLVASVCAVFTAYLTASNQLRVVYGCLVLRGGPTMVALLLTSSVLALASTYAAGELLRLLVLRRVVYKRTARNLSRPATSAMSPPKISEWLHQVISMSMSQAFPLVTRFFLGLSFAGAVAIGDAADKMFFAFSQVMLIALLLPDVASFPTKLRASAPHQIRALVVRDLLRAGAAAGVLAFVGGTLSIVMSQSFANLLGEELTKVCLWGAILLVGLPFWAINVVAGRVLLLAKDARVLPIIAFATLVVSVALNLVFIREFGAVGTIVASVLTQVVVGSLCGVVAVRRAPQRLKLTLAE